MALLASAMIMLLAILGGFGNFFAQEEMRAAVRLESAEQMHVPLYAYSNYVRDVFRDVQQKGLFNAGVSPQHARVLGNSIANGGTGVNSSSVSAMYLQGDAISRLGLGNVLVKGSSGKWYQYVWANPESGEVQAHVTRGLARDSLALYYIKNGSSLIMAGDPGNARPIEGGAENVVPNGAIVLINQPIEQGP